MHLKHIKLAGFKSFAEPTQIPVPGQRVGIVGPNGCGKSNVIDAVRWVLGESQARHLRGETLQDVIFGGTATRKPQGRASVELVFDNSQGRIAGQWGAYAEVAVRRVLERDGVSSYYINNLHVRRRDVQDIFMGTGLGPRAYAIIEQGMISRIVESRPEDIRVFLEEAAGVSRYKERRRETELRLEDTRSHLQRTEDIRRELGQQIEKLQGQAEVAAQWRSLQEALTQTRNVLFMSRRRDAEASRERIRRELEKSQVALDEAVAALRDIERQMEERRTEHYAATDALNSAQGRFYQSSADVSQAENALQAIRTERRRLEEELARLDQDIREDRQRLESEQTQWTMLEAERERAVELVRVALSRVEAERELLPQAETRLQEQRQLLDQARQKESQVQGRIAALRSEQAAAEMVLRQVEERLQRMEAEQSRWEVPDGGALERLSRELREQEVQAVICKAMAESTVQRLTRCEAVHAESRQQVDLLHREKTRLEAELKTLGTLQSRVGAQERANALIREHGLTHLPRFWQGLEVQPGWERAVEAALGSRLNAFAVEGYQDVMAWEGASIPAGVALYLSGTTPAGGQVSDVPALAAGRLLDRVSVRREDCRSALEAWLSHVFVVDDHRQALVKADQIPEGVCLVTRDGHSVDRHGVTFFSEQGEFHGALARARDMEELETALQEVMGRIARQEARHRESTEALQACRSERQGHDQQWRDAESRRHKLEVERTRLQGLQERHHQRMQQAMQERQELLRQDTLEKERRTSCGAKLVEAEEEWQGIREQVAVLEASWREADRVRETRRNALQTAERSLQEAQYMQKSTQERLEHLDRNRRAAESRLAQLEPRREALAEKLEQSAEAPFQDRLQSALAGRMACEEALSHARMKLEELTGTIRELDERRLSLQQRQEPLKNGMSDLRLKEQEARLLQEQAEENLRASGADEASLVPLLEKGVRSGALQAEIAALSEKIEALGAVNLAALEELETAKERKGWLDAQTADLEAAVATLEDAMRKIDRESRDQLKDTFERVNTNFGSLFTTLFGGGQARIELTGEEILDAGLQIIAQPPGKKTASLHLLSGGEKALTALSLVFALFQLNPAPFCILDEVDAPLDDANAERFVQMVTKMSEQTQFLFVTHNKVAMEMAQQLVGITMAESGVSRMVAVDMDEAIRMTESVIA